MPAYLLGVRFWHPPSGTSPITIRVWGLDQTIEYSQTYTPVLGLQTLTFTTPYTLFEGGVYEVSYAFDNLTNVYGVFGEESQPGNTIIAGTYNAVTGASGTFPNSLTSNSWALDPIICLTVGGADCVQMFADDHVWSTLFASSGGAEAGWRFVIRNPLPPPTPIPGRARAFSQIVGD